MSSAQILGSQLDDSNRVLASFLTSPAPLSVSSHYYHASTIPFLLEELSAYSPLLYFHCLTGESQAPQRAQRALPIGSYVPFLLVDRSLTFLPLCLGTHCASSLEDFPCLVHLVNSYSSFKTQLNHCCLEIFLHISRSQVPSVFLG